MCWKDTLVMTAFFYNKLELCQHEAVRRAAVLVDASYVFITLWHVGKLSCTHDRPKTSKLLKFYKPLFKRLAMIKILKAILLKIAAP